MNKPDFATILIETALRHIGEGDPELANSIRETLRTDTAMLAFVLFCINTSAGVASSTALAASLN